MSEPTTAERRPAWLHGRPLTSLHSEHADDERRSIEAALDLDIEVILGGTNVDPALAVIGDAPVEGWLFSGQVVGYSGLLRGELNSIVASARDLAARDGLHLLAYRFDGDVPALARAVEVPVLAAGGVVRIDRVAALRSAGVWGNINRRGRAGRVDGDRRGLT